ncbi:MAG TPA: hypothetical protein VF457_06070 [Burkholderiaceae bacterium]
MATQTLPDSAPAPPEIRPSDLSLAPIPASLGRFSEPMSEGREAATTALDLLRVWIAACEALATLPAAGEGDVDALGWTMVSIGDLLKQLEAGGRDMPHGFFAAKSTLQTLEMHLSVVVQGSELPELPPAAMAGAASYAYRLLAGLYGRERAPS